MKNEFYAPSYANLVIKKSQIERELFEVKLRHEKELADVQTRLHYARRHVDECRSSQKSLDLPRIQNALKFINVDANLDVYPRALSEIRKICEKFICDMYSSQSTSLSNYLVTYSPSYGYQTSSGVEKKDKSKIVFSLSMSNLSHEFIGDIIYALIMIDRILEILPILKRLNK